MEDMLINITDETLFDEIPCFISIQDVDGKILKSNRRFKETFGDSLGCYCYELYKRRGSKCPDCSMDWVIKENITYKHEELVFSQDGEPLYVLVQTKPVLDKNGKAIGVMEIATDISESKRIQNILEETTKKYKTLYNEVPCYITVQDSNFKIVDLNKKFVEEFGGKRGEYCYEVYKHRSTRCEVCPVAEVFEDGKVHFSEEIVARKDGEPINVLVSAAPIYDNKGEIVSVMEMSTDITSIRQMQSQMQNVGELVASLAHTIKGIITGLEGGMYVVESGFSQDKDEMVKKGWDMVQRNVERVSHLVLDMLYYAKTRTPDIKEVDLGKLCKDIYELYRKKFEDFNIKISIDIQDIEPFIGDSKSLYTLILNLVENAIDACKWDKIKSDHFINIKLTESKGIIKISVQDNGIGITDETKSKLFSVMYSTKGNSGSGFGLMVVKKIIDEHKGNVYIDSIPGEGATFIIELFRTHDDIQNLNNTIL